MKAFLAIACVALAGCLTADAARFDGLSFTVGSNSLTKGWSNVFKGVSPVTIAEESRAAVVLLEYAVPPPVQEKFVELSKALQAATEKEEGVKVFGLSRTVDENLTFYLYSEWEDAKSLGEHFKSDYAKKYIEEIAKIGVVWKLHFLDEITNYTPK